MSKQSREKSQSLKTMDGADFEVPVEVSLGLLALGYRGLVAWRSKKISSNYALNQHLFIPKPKKNKNVKKNS